MKNWILIKKKKLKICQKAKNRVIEILKPYDIIFSSEDFMCYTDTNRNNHGYSVVQIYMNVFRFDYL